MLLEDPPSPTASRTLTLVAKAVQSLANLVEFGTKVRWKIHILLPLSVEYRSRSSFLIFWIVDTGAIYGGCEPFHQEQQGQNDYVSGWAWGRSFILTQTENKSHFLSLLLFVTESFPVICLHTIFFLNNFDPQIILQTKVQTCTFVLMCRMFLSYLTLQSTLRQTCRGTWLHCISCVSATPTSCAPSATNVESNRCPHFCLISFGGLQCLMQPFKNVECAHVGVDCYTNLVEHVYMYIM